MKKTLSAAMVCAVSAATALYAFAAVPEKASIGSVSPNFTVAASSGKSISLDNYRGKYVVLEWTNKDCPFVKAHYDSGNMQATQEKAKAMGAVWFSVISSAQGAPGYMTAEEVNQYRKDEHVKSTATLLDSEGTVGHMYNARTTPQIVIIDPKGVVLFDGGIDDAPSPDANVHKTARNYAIETLKEAMAGKEIALSNPRPYGCGIKYAQQ